MLLISYDIYRSQILQMKTHSTDAFKRQYTCKPAIKLCVCLNICKNNTDDQMSNVNTIVIFNILPTCKTKLGLFTLPFTLGYVHCKPTFNLR